MTLGGRQQHFDSRWPWKGREKARLKASIDSCMPTPRPRCDGDTEGLRGPAVLRPQSGAVPPLPEIEARNIRRKVSGNGFIGHRPSIRCGGGGGIVGCVTQAVAQAISARARPILDHLAEIVGTYRWRSPLARVRGVCC